MLGLRGRDCPGLPRGAGVITRGLKREWQEGQSQRRRGEDGGRGQSDAIAGRAHEPWDTGHLQKEAKAGTQILPEPPRTQLCQGLDITYFELQNLKRTRLCCFKPPTWWQWPQDLPTAPRRDVSREDLAVNVQSSFMDNGPQVETTQMSLMGKGIYSVVCPCNGILHSSEKE